MNLGLTNHFKDKLIERGLSVDHIKKAIRDPDERSKAQDAKVVVIKAIEDKRIKVIYFRKLYKNNRDEYVLISAYYI